MAITRSLGIGASSLSAHQQKFDVISNNLANINTIGFKSNRMNFQDFLYQTKSYGNDPSSGGSASVGGRNPMQFGLGVKAGSISQDMSQGMLESTNRPLDLSLQGDGFFIYQRNGQQLFSRAGAVSIDNSGNIVDSSTGAHLQGYNVNTDAAGRVMKDASGVNLLNVSKENLNINDNVISAPRQTENISFTGNLKSTNEEDFVQRTSIKIFDTQGSTHDLQIAFTKTANPNEYAIAASLNGADVPLSEATLIFNNDGTLQSPVSASISAADLNNVIGNAVFDEDSPSDINVDFANPNNLSSGLTSYATNNSATINTQNGYGAGALLSMEVDEKGMIRGAFSNGESEILGQVLIAKFTNQDGLTRTGENFFRVSPNSGIPNIGTAVEVFPSTKISGYTLEQSNVDMTKEFTDMISTQRAYEAAARTITVSDQLLAETTVLKR